MSYAAAAKHLHHRYPDFVGKWVKRFQLTKCEDDLPGQDTSRVNHMKRCLEWARKYLEFDWSDTAFTNESSFWCWLTRRKFWYPVIKRTVKLPIKSLRLGLFQYLRL